VYRPAGIERRDEHHHDPFEWVGERRDGYLSLNGKAR